MRILHTSDWHLGKRLEGQSRVGEQRKFINTLGSIVSNEKIDLVLVAGDIFDTYNPSAEAETLFFDSLKILSNNGKVGVIIIPGNHDNPQRLCAISNIAKDLGVIIYERAFQEIPVGDYGSFSITKSTAGGIEIQKDEKSIFVYSLPFPSEATLNESFDNIKFNDRIREILEEGVIQNNKDIPTVVMTHIYVAGSMGDNESESLELGGAKAISINDLPNVSYIALGHVHRPMHFKDKNAYYSGSPIEYRVTENKFNKKVYIVDFINNDTVVQDVAIDNYKPIKEYIVNGAEEAIEKSIFLKDHNEWIYLKIILDEPLTNSQIRKIKSNKNIVEIIPIVNSQTEAVDDINYSEENIQEAFIEFFKEESNGMEPTQEIKNLFLELIEEENHETN